MVRTDIYRKKCGNAAAFVRVTGNIATVYGKIYDGKNAYTGPESEIKVCVPEALRLEVGIIGSWVSYRTPELNAFCEACLKKAAEADSWFKMFLPE